jgi:hypothetical protein
LLRSSETNVKDVKAFRAALSKRDAYDALHAGGMGELLLDDKLIPLDNEIEKCGQNAAERIILVYEGEHREEKFNCAMNNDNHDDGARPDHPDVFLKKTLLPSRCDCNAN